MIVEVMVDNVNKIVHTACSTNRQGTVLWAKHKRLIGGQMMLLKTILESVMWSPKVRSGVAHVSPETPTTVIANLIARAINELATLRQPTSWVNKKTTIHASYERLHRC